MRREQTLADRISGSSLWRSVVRHGYPDTQRNQALIIASNVFLHIHPVKIKRYATKVTYTFCLGGLSFFMFLVTMTDRRQVHKDRRQQTKHKGLERANEEF